MTQLTLKNKSSEILKEIRKNAILILQATSIVLAQIAGAFILFCAIPSVMGYFSGDETIKYSGVNFEVVFIMVNSVVLIISYLLNKLSHRLKAKYL